MFWQTIEKFCFPTQSVLSQQKGGQFDLTDAELASLTPASSGCKVCGLALPKSRVCPSCQHSLPSFERTQAAFVYDGILVDLLHQFKFGQQRSHGRLLGQISQAYFDASAVDALLPIPLHPLRRRERGFNQAQRLAHYWGKYHQLPVVEDALCRVEHTPAQAQLDREQRLSNLQSAFRLKQLSLQSYTSIALVDDVMTTGATLEAAAKVIKAQYPKLSIQVWVLARAQDEVGVSL